MPSHSDRQVTLVGGPHDGLKIRVVPGTLSVNTPGTIDTGYAYRPREKDATEWHYDKVDGDA